MDNSIIFKVSNIKNKIQIYIKIIQWIIDHLTSNNNNISIKCKMTTLIKLELEMILITNSHKKWMKVIIKWMIKDIMSIKICINLIIKANLNLNRIIIIKVNPMVIVCSTEITRVFKVNSITMTDRKITWFKIISKCKKFIMTLAR